MEFLFSIVGHRLTIGMRGIVDHTFKLAHEIHKLLKANDNITEIVFVLRKVDKVDKKGVEVWVKEVKDVIEKGYTVTLIECPKELLEPLLKADKNMPKALRSFLVPYYCESCQEEFPQLINTNSLMLSFAAYSMPSCPKCKKRLKLDITDDEIERITSLLPIKDAYSDKRKYPRFDASVYKIRVKAVRRGDSEEGYFELVNFSEIGLCIAGKMCFEPGDLISIHLTHKKKSVSADGSVVWRSLDQDGNCFHGISLSSRDIFYLLIKE
jgi:hypothetical protein